MDNEISIAQALNHGQSWLNSGEFNKVIQGCQEILEIEPGNARATALMKMAEERRLADVKGEPMPEHEPMPEAEPAPAPLQVEEEPMHPAASNFELPPEEEPDEDHFEKRKLFSVLIPAVCGLIGGSAIWWLAIYDRENEIRTPSRTKNGGLPHLEQTSTRDDIQNMKMKPTS
jgi:hypothetical protein